MLGLNIDVNIDINKVHMPIHFDKRNICVHCGCSKSLIFIDKFGKESRMEVNAFDHIKCKNCGKIYSILWEKDEDNDKMYPSAVEPSINRDLTNLIGIKNIKNTGLKSLE